MPIMLCQMFGHLEFINAPNKCPVCFANSFKQEDGIFKEAIANMKRMDLAESVSMSFVEPAHAFDSYKVYVTQLSPNYSNTPTRFEQFIQEVFIPAYQNA